MEAPSIAPAGIQLPPGITLDSTLGALLVCVVVAVALFGVICLQTYYYFNHYLKDQLYIKILASPLSPWKTFGSEI